MYKNAYNISTSIAWNWRKIVENLWVKMHFKSILFYVQCCRFIFFADLLKRTWNVIFSDSDIFPTTETNIGVGPVCACRASAGVTYLKSSNKLLQLYMVIVEDVVACSIDKHAHIYQQGISRDGNLTMLTFRNNDDWFSMFSFCFTNGFCSHIFQPLLVDPVWYRKR